MRCLQLLARTKIGGTNEHQHTLHRYENTDAQLSLIEIEPENITMSHASKPTTTSTSTRHRKPPRVDISHLGHFDRGACEVERVLAGT